MKRAVSSLVFAIPVLLSLQSCGGDLHFGDVSPGLYLLSYERSRPAGRAIITGDIMVEVDEKGGVDFVLHDLVLGSTFGTGNIDDRGNFTATSGSSVTGFRGDPTVTIEGRVRGSGENASVEATVSGDIDADVSGTYYSDGQTSPWVADYDGNLTGSLSGILDIDVFSDGTLTSSLGVGDDFFTGSGTVSSVGFGTINLTLAPGRQGDELTLYGYFYIHEGVQYASGTYEGTVDGSSVNGNWTAERD
ncbi:MAG: hypothetical protein JNK63_10105 [Chthonomonas sp.]|nr:hypothetical protein [Chthonomonas sp.]